jgi:hypothetical protein
MRDLRHSVAPTSEKSESGQNECQFRPAMEPPPRRPPDLSRRNGLALGHHLLGVWGRLPICTNTGSAPVSYGLDGEPEARGKLEPCPPL